jgi:hypothetical protein
MAGRAPVDGRLARLAELRDGAFDGNVRRHLARTQVADEPGHS